MVPLELINPSAREEGAAGDDGRRVAQSTPLPGGPGRLAYIHTAPALLEPLTAFAAWPLGREFALAELPARDPFLGACAARALLGLDVLDVLAEGAEPGAGGSVDIA